MSMDGRTGCRRLGSRLRSPPSLDQRGLLYGERGAKTEEVGVSGPERT